MNQVDCYGAAMQRGSVLLQAREYDKAIAAFEEAIGARPDSAEVLFQIARCLADSDRNIQALDYVERGRALAPDSAFPHSLRSWILCNLSRPADAFQEAVPALQKSPSDLIALTARARALVLMKDYQSAAFGVKEILKVSPYCTYALSLMAGWSTPGGTFRRVRNLWLLSFSSTRTMPGLI